LYLSNQSRDAAVLQKILQTRFVFSYFPLLSFGFQIIILAFVLMFFCWERPASKPSFLFSLYWASIFLFFFFGRLMHFFMGLFCSSNQHMLFISVLEIYMVRCKWIKKKKKKKSVVYLHQFKSSSEVRSIIWLCYF
jgi:hypothetical protein